LGGEEDGRSEERENAVGAHEGTKSGERRGYGPGMAIDFTEGLSAARSPIAVRQLALFHHPVVSYCGGC